MMASFGFFKGELMFHEVDGFVFVLGRSFNQFCFQGLIISGLSDRARHLREPTVPEKKKRLGLDINRCEKLKFRIKNRCFLSLLLTTFQ